MAVIARTLFHGTSTGYLSQILRNGLDPKSSCKKYLCYTDDLAIAKHHATHMAEWDEVVLEKTCRPVIFAIPSDQFLPTGFCLDENFIDLGPSAGRAIGRPLAHILRSWHLVFNISGSVGYNRLLRVRRPMIIGRPVLDY